MQEDSQAKQLIRVKAKKKPVQDTTTIQSNVERHSSLDFWRHRSAETSYAGLPYDVRYPSSSVTQQSQHLSTLSDHRKNHYADEVQPAIKASDKYKIDARYDLLPIQHDPDRLRLVHVQVRKKPDTSAEQAVTRGGPSTGEQLLAKQGLVPRSHIVPELTTNYQIDNQHWEFKTFTSNKKFVQSTTLPSAEETVSHKAAGPATIDTLSQKARHEKQMNLIRTPTAIFTGESMTSPAVKHRAYHEKKASKRMRYPASTGDDALIARTVIESQQSPLKHTKKDLRKLKIELAVEQSSSDFITSSMRQRDTETIWLKLKDAPQEFCVDDITAEELQNLTTLLNELKTSRQKRVTTGTIRSKKDDDKEDSMLKYDKVYVQNQLPDIGPDLSFTLKDDEFLETNKKATAFDVIEKSYHIEMEKKQSASDYEALNIDDGGLNEFVSPGKELKQSQPSWAPRRVSFSEQPTGRPYARRKDSRKYSIAHPVNFLPQLSSGITLTPIAGEELSNYFYSPSQTRRHSKSSGTERFSTAHARKDDTSVSKIFLTGQEESFKGMRVLEGRSSLMQEKRFSRGTQTCDWDSYQDRNISRSLLSRKGEIGLSKNQSLKMNMADAAVGCYASSSSKLEEDNLVLLTDYADGTQKGFGNYSVMVEPDFCENNCSSYGLNQIRSDRKTSPLFSHALTQTSTPRGIAYISPGTGRKIVEPHTWLVEETVHIPKSTTQQRLWIPFTNLPPQSESATIDQSNRFSRSYARDKYKKYPSPYYVDSTLYTDYEDDVEKTQPEINAVMTLPIRNPVFEALEPCYMRLEDRKQRIKRHRSRLYKIAILVDEAQVVDTKVYHQTKQPAFISSEVPIQDEENN